MPNDESLITALRSALGLVGHTVRAFETSLSPTLLAFVESMQRLPDEAKPGIRALMERGWFISGEMGASELRDFSRIASTESSEELDLRMAEWIRSEAKSVISRASNRFPKREKILRAAFEAHLVGSYELSVPIIFIQVEGMCVEVLGKKLFSAKNDIPNTKQTADALINGAFSEVVLLPMREVHGVTASEKARANWPEAPNRHEILHGIDIEYGNEMNSLKALSLLEYFVTILAK